MNQFVPTSISMGRELAEAAERLRCCTVEVRGTDSARGSGVIWRPDGLIVTNAHVATSPRATVQLHDGRTLAAELIGRDTNRDLAALQITAAALPPAQLRDASSLRAGEVVLAVGNPMGIPGAFTVGVVAVTPQPADVLVRADIRLAPGNSGGPLADVHGRIVGINSMVVGGFGIAVTSTAVERFLRGHDRRIGVTVQAVRAPGEALSGFGLLVVGLEPGGAAHLSDLRIGDVIVGVNGQRLDSAAQLSEAIQAAERVLSLEILRDGRLELCDITEARETVTEMA